MLIQLDWVSFSLPLPFAAMSDDEAAAHYAREELEYFLGDTYHLLEGWGALEQGSGRRPFSTSFRSAGGEVSIYLNHKLTHFLVELSGTGTKGVMQSEQGRDFLRIVGNRVTRIDIACDIHCETNPLAFTDERGQGRFKTHSEIVSETGQTYYVGSKKSNRYARVYRYNKPHPRHELLRVEHVFRDNDAKETMKYFLENGEEKTAQQCALMYQWQHKAWDISPATEKEMTAYRPDRENANTLFWVHKTVAPLLARLTKEGSLNLEEFFNNVWALSVGFPETKPIDTATGELL